MKKHNSTIRKQTGFTLIEVLIAMAIFTIGILSMYSMQITSMKGNVTANRVTESAEMTSDYVEQILSQNPGWITGNGTVGDISWVLQTNTPNAGMDTIQVTVSQQGWGAKPITISYIKPN